MSNYCLMLIHSSLCSTSLNHLLSKERITLIDTSKSIFLMYEFILSSQQTSEEGTIIIKLLLSSKLIEKGWADYPVPVTHRHSDPSLVFNWSSSGCWWRRGSQGCERLTSYRSKPQFTSQHLLIQTRSLRSRLHFVSVRRASVGGASAFAVSHLLWVEERER